MFEPGIRPWGPEEGAIKRALEALLIFGVVQPHH